MIFVTPSSDPDCGADPASSSLVDAPDALPAGSAVGSFVLSGVASRDEFGICYRATSSASDTQVTIEEYAPAQIARRVEDGVLVPRSPDHAELLADGQRAFLHEAEQFSRLSHPSLLRIGPTWRTRGTAYRLRIGGEGRPLAEALEELGTRPDEPWLRRWLAPLLDALDLVHTGGWVHGNLRPGRVAMREDGTPVLLDSGAVALTLASRLPAPRAWSEPEFLPVELQESASTLPVGPWSDLYSLAALVVWCHSGSRAEDAAGWSRLAAGCGGLRRALQAALQDDPARRPQSVAEFRELMKDSREREARAPHESRAPHEADGGASTAAVKDMLLAVTGHEAVPAGAARRPGAGHVPHVEAREPAWSERFDGPALRDDAIEPDDVPGWFPAAPRGASPQSYAFARPARRWPWAVGGAAVGALATAALTMFLLRPSGELYWTPSAGLPSLGTLATGPSATPTSHAGPAAAGARTPDAQATAALQAAETARRVAAAATGAGAVPVAGRPADPALTGPATPVAGTASPAATGPVATAVAPAPLPAPATLPGATPAPAPTAAPTEVATATVLAPGSSGAPAASGAPAPAPLVAGAAAIAPAAPLLEKATQAGSAAGGSRAAPLQTAATPAAAERHGGEAREAIAAARREENELAENPAAACSPRTNFALYRCMQIQCEQRRFFTHPQCIRLRVRDEVS